MLFLNHAIFDCAMLLHCYYAIPSPNPYLDIVCYFCYYAISSPNPYLEVVCYYATVSLENLADWPQPARIKILADFNLVDGSSHALNLPHVPS